MPAQHVASSAQVWPEPPLVPLPLVPPLVPCVAQAGS
jgi:hypothetical protein